MPRALLFAVLVASCACTKSSAPAPAATQPLGTEQAQRERCCAQCSAAASRDPAGMDLSGKTCTSYPAEWNGGPGVLDDCRGWFVAQPRPLTVGECAKAEPDAL